MTLTEFKKSIPTFSQKGHPEKIKLFGWFLHEYVKQVTFSPADIKQCYDGLHEVAPGSFSGYFKNLVSQQVLLKSGAGYRLAGPARDAIAVELTPAQPLKSATQALRKLLPRIANPDVRAFVEEGIGCMDHQLLKASVVFVWVGAVAVLHDFVVKTKLAAFNADAVAKDSKWRAAVDSDGLGLMKEADFLDALVRIGVIGKNVKTELKHSLDLRNACGHPNSLVIGEAKVLAHIETLVLNVFEKF
jgi:hypothetical protein